MSGSICSTYIALNLRGDGGALLVDDRVDLLDHVEVRLVVGVLDARAPPWHVRELPGGEHVRDVGLAGHLVGERAQEVRRLDEVLKHVELRRQRVPVVQHFVEQLNHRGKWVISVISLGDKRLVGPSLQRLVERISALSRDKERAPRFMKASKLSEK